MLQQRPLVELEVRRPDHRDGVGTGLGGVRSQRDGVARRLRATVRGDEQPASRRRDVELDDAPALLGA